MSITVRWADGSDEHFVDSISDWSKPSYYFDVTEEGKLIIWATKRSWATELLIRAGFQEGWDVERTEIGSFQAGAWRSVREQEEQDELVWNMCWCDMRAEFPHPQLRTWVGLPGGAEDAFQDYRNYWAGEDDEGSTYYRHTYEVTDGEELVISRTDFDGGEVGYPTLVGHYARSAWTTVRQELQCKSGHYKTPSRESA